MLTKHSLLFIKNETKGFVFDIQDWIVYKQMIYCFTLKNKGLFNTLFLVTVFVFSVNVMMEQKLPIQLSVSNFFQLFKVEFWWMRQTIN